MDDIVYDFSADTLEEAGNRNLSRLFIRMVGGISGAGVYDGPDIAWSITDTDFWFMNTAVPLALTDMANAASESRERAAARGVQASWWVSPRALQGGIGEHLLAHGFVDVGGPPAMAVELEKLPANSDPPTGLTIQLVETAAQLDDWVEVLVTGYPMPELCRVPIAQGALHSALDGSGDVRLYVGYWNGKPVTCSQMLLAGGVAGIYCVATLEAARRKGLGRHITLAPLRQARANGYRIGMLQASQMGHSVYQRLGFEDIFHYTLFMLRPQ